MFRTIRKTCLWLFAILTAAAIGLGIVGYRFWANADQILHKHVETAIAEWYPEANFELGRFKLDWLGRIHVEQFSLTLPESDKPLIDLPDTVVDLDRDALIHRQEAVVLNLKFLQPQIEVTRLADGTWDFQNLPPIPRSGKRSSLPTCDLNNARLVVNVVRPGQQTPATLIIDNADIKLTPNGKRSLLLDGAARLEHIGQLAINGRVNIDTKTGSLEGRLVGVELGDELLQYASSFAPSIQQKVTALEKRLLQEMRKEPDPAAKSPFSIAGIADEPMPGISNTLPASTGNSSVQILQAAGSQSSRGRGHSIPTSRLGASDSILGLLASLDISFRATVPAVGAEPDVDLAVNVTDGQLTNTALPFPFDNLRGQIEYNDQQLTIRKLTATNGPTQFGINGSIYSPSEQPAGQVNLKLKNLHCDERLRSRLSVGFGRVYDIHHPSGSIDLEVSLVSNSGGKWMPQGLLVRANHAAIAHDIFPYPVTEAVGTIAQDGSDLRIDMMGKAGDRPISLKGFVRDPGPNARIVFEIDVEDLPLDDTFLTACNPKLQNVLTSMNLTGLVDAHWRLERTPERGPKMVPSLVGFLKQGTMAFRSFPYGVTDLSGRLDFDGLDWKFTELQGRHGEAHLHAEGSYTRSAGQGDLNLTVTTEDADIDESLRSALPSHLKKLWAEFSPAGKIKRVVTKVRMQEGQPARITLPELHVVNGRSLMKMFPYELTDINATYEYADGLLKILSWQGRHNDTQLSGEGTIRTEKNGDWRTTLNRWSAKNLRTDESFQRALSPGLKEVFSAFDTQQILNMTGFLELRGTTDPKFPITAAWEIATDLQRSRVSAGMDFTDVYGRVISTGTWDGYKADVDGIMDIGRLKIFDKYVLYDVRGPFSLKDGIISIGSREALRSNQSNRAVDSSEQINARFVGGVLTVNGQATSEEPSDYEVRVNLSHGQLKRFAQLYMNSRDRLEGVMNGWVTLQGRGPDAGTLKGRGQLQISPAALYEAPVVFQVLNTLTATPQDNSFFEYARVDFQIADEKFNFSAIDLVGSPMQLHGTGTAGFDDSLDLKFVSMLPNSRLRKPQVWIPIVSEVAGLVGGVTNLVGVVVEVSGTKTNPQTKVIPAKNLDDAFKQFVRSLKPLPLTPPSPPTLPSLAFPGSRRQ